MSSSSCCCPSTVFLSLACVLSLLISTTTSSTTSPTVTLSLSPFTTKKTNHSDDPWQRLSHMVSASLTRVHHIKNPKTKSSPSSSVTKSPMYTHSYGGYSIFLKFGTPPQTTSLVMDTGSSLVWIPCTSRYICSRCKFPHIDSSKIPTFIPKLSSSAKIIGCKNPKCSFLYGPDVSSRCKDCAPNASNCTQSCPPYLIQYGSGSTAGLLMSENLDFPNKIVSDFLVGCSIFSTRQPAGIAGFGRGAESLPAQMGLKKFAYCLVSHRFDDLPVSSNLVLQSGSNGDDKTPGLSYTSFRKIPAGSKSVYKTYYYLTLRKIIVGDRAVKVPYNYLVPGADGNGGTIVDSGSTLTFMEKPVFEAVAQEFERQMSNYSRDVEIEKQSGFRPCFDVSKDKKIAFPDLFLQFKGGAQMALPLANYFSFVGSEGVLCMTIVTDGVLGPANVGGPAIILGNYQQQNFYIEYDLENERFGFMKRLCK